MKFLIVEDEKHLNNLLYDYLKDKFEDAELDQVFDGFDALSYINEKDYTLILLDVMLPSVDGFDICKRLREKDNTPVIMLSALNDEENQIRGYNLGIDEYIPKPYSPKLVVKKVEAVLKRYNKLDENNSLTYGEITYNLKQHTIKINELDISLNKKEWDLFSLFINNPSRIFSREELLNKVWGYDYFGDIRTVDTHIKRLRKKLTNDAPYIKTIFKEGYKFEK